MIQRADKTTLSLFALIVLIIMIISFQYTPIFWFSYTNLLGIGIIFAFFFGNLMNKQSLLRSLFIGIPIGVIGYFTAISIYNILAYISPVAFQNVKELLEIYSPTAIWQYAALLIVIVLGEEMIWRVYLQQELKKMVSKKWAVLISAIHFGLPLLICGFYIGAIAAFLSGIIFGGLYEWLKSLPIVFTAHITMAIFLFLLFPLT